MPAQITMTGSAVDFMEMAKPCDDVGGVAGGPTPWRWRRTGRYSVPV
jgi:hypothetical protein